MYHDKRVLGLIPARAGSKGLPNKNLLTVGGKPMVQLAAESGRDSRFIDEVLITTDGPEIAECAVAAGAIAPFLRPAQLASDTSRMVDVIEHALAWLQADGRDFDLIALLQPTSPLRTAAHVDAAFRRLEETGGRAVVSVCPVEHSPLIAGTIPANGSMRTFLTGETSRLNRQELGDFYRLNGAIYVADIAYWRDNGGFFGDETYSYVMPTQDSVDVDSALDLRIARCLAGDIS